MPALFDTHCHLTHPPLYAELAQVVAEARKQQVDYFLIPGTAPDDWQNILQLLRQNTCFYAALGIHPWYTQYHNASNITLLAELLSRFPSLLVGEIGLDFRHAQTEASRSLQKNCFEAQLDLAQQYQRPVIVHHVQASTACMDIIKRHHFQYGGFAHAFSGSLQEAEAWHRLGFMIGVGSLLLNPRARKIQRIAAELPLSHIVLETDAPYMLPGHQCNYPSNTRHIADIIARLRGCHWQEVAEICTSNAFRYVSL